MPDSKREAIKRFLNDQETAKAVHGFLVRAFLKPPKERDVQSLAAAWMAKDIFDEGWKEMGKLKSDTEIEKKSPHNPGL